jgi:hypothetical protein
MNLNKRKLKKIDDEIWKIIPKTDNRYEISNYGRIKSFALNRTDGNILKCSINKGFKTFNLRTNEKNTRVYVHKLVAEIWLKKPSENHTFVTHIDRNLKNNHFINLRWLSQEEIKNEYRDYFKKKYNSANKRKIVTNSKLTENDVIQLKSMLKRGVSQSTIAKLFCVSEMQVTRIKREENWNHIIVR